MDSVRDASFGDKTWPGNVAREGSVGFALFAPARSLARTVEEGLSKLNVLTGVGPTQGVSRPLIDDKTKAAKFARLRPAAAKKKECL